MNFEEFKEQFIDDIKKQLYENGIVASVETHEVSKLNESYEAITVTPEGSNVGVNVNMDRFFEALENGTDYESVVLCRHRSTILNRIILDMMNITIL